MKLEEFEGKIQIVREDLTTYEGDWKNNMKEGQGMETYKDGSYYIGEFKVDKRNN